MPPRRRSGAAASTPDHLTADNLAALATAVAEGKRATVYLREATPSLGIEAGTSAKVVSVDGNTVMIRPKGVNDELPFEAEELRINRVSAAPASSAPRPKPVVESEPLMEPLVEPVRPKPRAQPAPAPVPTTTAAPAATPRPAVKRAKKLPAGISVTIHAGADNDWSVTVTQGAKRPGKAVPVAPDAVERAVRELGEPTAIEAVESIIVAARDMAAARVDELSRQLEEARKMLEALGATD
ncbi:translation initiation factor [Rhodococcus sp. P27]|nr:translation initiation factor [Rhodococcus sp. P27]